MVKLARNSDGVMLTDASGQPFLAGLYDDEYGERMIAALSSIASGCLPFKEKAVVAMRERYPELDSVDAYDLADHVAKQRYKKPRRRK